VGRTELVVVVTMVVSCDMTMEKSGLSSDAVWNFGVGRQHTVIWRVQKESICQEVFLGTG
jgi:hypothetical protein